MSALRQRVAAAARGARGGLRSVGATLRTAVGRIGALPRRAAIAGAAAVVLVVGGAGVAWATTGSTASGYVTATAETGSVDETLTLSGTIASATRRDLAFPVGGTVAAVAVSAGDVVEAGDELAELDTDQLEQAVDAAAEAVARAEETLADDLESQTATSDTASAASTGAGSSGSTGTTSDFSAEIAAVTAAQQTLLDLIDAADASLAAAGTAVADADSVCAPFLEAELVAEADEPVEPTDGGGGVEEGDDAADEDADTLAAVQELLEACQAAIAGTATAQSVTQAAQEAVAAAMDALDDAVAALQAAAGGESGGAGGAGGGASSSSTGSTSSGSSAAGGTGSPTSTVASAADIAADRAEIAAAEAELAVARAQLAAAVLTSPIDGTVAQVAFAVGDEVSAGSTTAVITVIGDDGYVVEATVGLDDLQRLTVGMTGTAMLPSSGVSYAATLASVGFVNVATDSSTPAYGITIAVDADGDVLLNGAAVQIAIEVAVAADVIVVPVSALHRADTGDTVDVLVDGAVETRQVEVGALGAEYVQIVTGLDVGDTVVLADRTLEISSGDDDVSTGLTGLGETQTTGPGQFTGGGPAGGPPQG